MTTAADSLQANTTKPLRRGRSGGNFKLPTGLYSLIYITTESEAALEALASEVAQYGDAREALFIAWPGRTQFGRQMMRRLADSDTFGRFVRLCTSRPNRKESTNESWMPRIKRYIEALLIADGYPGTKLFGASFVSRFNTRLPPPCIVYFEGRTFESLMESVRISWRSKIWHPTVLITLLGPSSLTLAHIGAVTRLVHANIPDAFPVIFAATADAERITYALYLTIFE